MKTLASKPRNPYVVLALRRKAGAHIKSEKSVRQKEKKSLLKKLINLVFDETS